MRVERDGSHPIHYATKFMLLLTRMPASDQRLLFHDSGCCLEPTHRLRDGVVIRQYLVVLSALQFIVPLCGAPE